MTAQSPLIPAEDLARLETLVSELNQLVARLHEHHAGSFDFSMFCRFREEETPQVSVTIRRIFAEFGR